MDEDEPIRKSVHTVGEPLDTISIGELEERIAALRAEIARIETVIEAKKAAHDAAAGFFKS